jgi:uncharacterized membrane protein
VLANNLKAA